MDENYSETTSKSISMILEFPKSMVALKGYELDMHLVCCLAAEKVVHSVEQKVAAMVVKKATVMVLKMVG